MAVVRYTGSLRKQQGMSVVELLMVLVIVLVVGLGIVRSLMWTSNQLFGRTDVKLASAVQAEHALDLIRADLEQASSSQGLACGDDQLSMRINDQPVIYFHSTAAMGSIPKDTLMRQTLGPNSVTLTQPVTGGITVFATRCTMPGLVTVGLTAQVNKAGLSAEQSLTTRVLLQNS